MVARISIKDALNDNFFYNENKIGKGEAIGLLAANFHTEFERLSSRQRLRTLENFVAMNSRIKVNSVHVSLNFDPSEKLSDDKLKEISKQYMERIGFGRQPYLVYRHFDAGHPHVHILSVKVNLEGKGMDTHLIGKRFSEPARKAIEEQYGLVKAEGRKEEIYNLKSAYSQKIDYGKMESRKAIAVVLSNVLNTYNYTSIAELNAVLNLYNVTADRCRETSMVYRFGGLLYRILDGEGKPVGVPIKASRFGQRPTLEYLESMFEKNRANRARFRSPLKHTIDRYFTNNSSPNFNALSAYLKSAGIDIILRTSAKGQVYGLTYVDHKRKVALKGSELGKPYSAKGILERCSSGTAKQNQYQSANVNNQGLGAVVGSPDQQLQHSIGNNLIDLLTQSEHTYNPTPYELKGKKKKKRRKQSND
ncbi:relaxase/mobilization nuclease domain-containing protein [Pedobacter sp. UBA4863]|uniref:relaxase/mobilization nuclease domain-containing protein n=1 Tax=Pedobacter sp. UBA4863 TaxID=1947060 RepID=UPI0025EBBD5B|nr:relaxase/mobilization nuclease domain-containing protein [Pedobacter sp. UBA4863]